MAMPASIEQLLGLSPRAPQPPAVGRKIAFSFLFFSDVRTDVENARKYEFVRDITTFADQAGFTAIYIPERHFYEFGSIFANPAIIASYLIPHTKNIRFRTAGVSLPLHHPAEVVEWWAMNDILSGGRVDLGFGSGWNRADFIYQPGHWERRRAICSDLIPVVQQLWRGDTVSFPGPDGEPVPIRVHPRPLQPELAVWLLVTQSDEGFRHAGRQGYNVFTMLYGNDFRAMEKKIALYRQGREDAGLEPDDGIVTLMLHTLVHEDRELVHAAVEAPFKAYIKSALDAHTRAALDASGAAPDSVKAEDKTRMLDYAYQRYVKTAAIFGTVDDGRRVVDEAIRIGVDEIACLVDFGVDYGLVKESLWHLDDLVSYYRPDRRQDRQQHGPSWARTTS